jgi:ABC-type lipoprotein export system ATPase subunit
LTYDFPTSCEPRHEQELKPLQVIRAVDIHRQYQLGKNNFINALRGASLSIDEGEMTAIIGPSGSGKSTLMHIMGCLDRPDQGEVWLEDQRVDCLPARRLPKLRAKKFGFIFQGHNLIPTLTAQENVALAAEYAGLSRRAASEEAEGALDAVGLADRMRHRPSELSGGQQHRVAIARALINKPQVVLGDEPTGDLDTVTSAEIVSLMRRINEETNTTFILVTHDPEVAAACRRVVQVRDGLVLDEAPVPRT